MRRSTVALLVLAGCLAAATARAQPAPAPGPMSDAARAVAALPAEIAGFRRNGGLNDLERMPNGRGMGATARYDSTGGERMIATIAIYDGGGRAGRVDGAENQSVTDELRAFDTTMNAMVRMGRYRSAAFATAMRIAPSAGALGVRCANYNVVQPNGTPTADSVCITVQRGMFLKVRLTAMNQADPAAAGIVAAGLTTAILQARASAKPG